MIHRTWIMMVSVLSLTACSQAEWRATAVHYGDNGGQGSLGRHTLHQGETVAAIAKKYQVDLSSIVQMNDLVSALALPSGQRLTIPAPENYKVRAGDTVYTIARLFDTSPSDMMKANHLSSSSSIRVGQILKIPKNIGSENLVAVNKLPITKSSPRILKVARAPSSLPQQPTAAIQKESLEPLVMPSPNVVTQPNISPVNLSNSGSRGLSFIKPVSGKIISGFGPKSDGLHNDGINIQASKGTPVRSAEAGEVVYQGNQIEGYGNMILVRHRDGYLTAYAHLEKILVKNGDRVSRGQTIGTVGNTGSVSLPQLHFEVRRGKEAIDPKQKLSNV
jgi:murein DD-endopeptidase MepM/ murein hydrolase activator NlpD